MLSGERSSPGGRRANWALWSSSDPHSSDPLISPGLLIPSMEMLQEIWKWADWDAVLFVSHTARTWPDCNW